MTVNHRCEFAVILGLVGPCPYCGGEDVVKI